MKILIGQKNHRSSGRRETGLTKKGKGKDEIAFETGTKPGTDPEVVFPLVVTPYRKKKDITHTTYVSMLVKLQIPKKEIDTLQDKFTKMVEMLLKLDDTIKIIPFDED